MSGKAFQWDKELGPTILETFVGDKNLDRIHNHGQRIIKFYSASSKNTFPMGHSLILFHLVMWCEVSNS